MKPIPCPTCDTPMAVFRKQRGNRVSFYGLCGECGARITLEDQPVARPGETATQIAMASLLFLFYIVFIFGWLLESIFKK